MYELWVFQKKKILVLIMCWFTWASSLWLFVLFLIVGVKNLTFLDKEKKKAKVRNTSLKFEGFWILYPKDLKFEFCSLNLYSICISSLFVHISLNTTWVCHMCLIISIKWLYIIFRMPCHFHYATWHCFIRQTNTSGKWKYGHIRIDDANRI